MQQHNFNFCCGINIIAGFPFDADTKQPFGEGELMAIIDDLPKYEGTYCHCHLIALNRRQKKAAEKVKMAGYVLIGEFDSAHNDGSRVDLYAKGLTPLTTEKPKTKKKKARKLLGLVIPRRKRK